MTKTKLPKEKKIDWEEKAVKKIKETYSEKVWLPVDKAIRAKDAVAAQLLRDMAPALIQLIKPIVEFEKQTSFLEGQREERKEWEVNHSIDVRYESNLIEAFNKFIEKWCGPHFGHLIDDDENDGEFVREKIVQAYNQGQRELKGRKK